MSVPTIRELMGEGPFSFAFEYVLARLGAEGIFTPWIGLDDIGEIDETMAERVFEGWHEAGKIKRTAEVGSHPPPPAAIALGGKYIYGGEESNVEGDLYKPIILGPGVRIRKKATVGNGTIVGDGVRIGTAHVVRSVLFPGVRVASNATIGDSVIGPGSKIESGVSLRSKTGRRSPRGTIVITDFRDPEQPEIDTGRKVLGALIGRDCLVEATLEPGCVLLPGCHIRSWMVGFPAGIYAPKFLDYLDERVVDKFRCNAREAALALRDETD